MKLVMITIMIMQFALLSTSYGDEVCTAIRKNGGDGFVYYGTSCGDVTGERIYGKKEEALEELKSKYSFVKSYFNSDVIVFSNHAELDEAAKACVVFQGTTTDGTLWDIIPTGGLLSSNTRTHKQVDCGWGVTSLNPDVDLDAFIESNVDSEVVQSESLLPSTDDVRGDVLSNSFLYRRILTIDITDIKFFN